MPRSAVPLVLSADQQEQIEQWLAAMGTPQQVALRCRIVLAAARGESETASASELGVNRKTAGAVLEGRVKWFVGNRAGARPQSNLWA